MQATLFFHGDYYVSYYNYLIISQIAGDIFDI